jgi:hypothetical protein
MKKSRLVALPSLLLGALTAHAAYASPYRGATLTWRVPDKAAPLTAEITVDQAWQAAAPGCVEIDFGDGTSSSACSSKTVFGTGLTPRGTPFVVQRYVVQHTYPSATTYTAKLADCCRMTDLVNGSGAPYKVETTLVLGVGDTSGPHTTTLPVLNLRAGSVATYDFPAFDDDGDPVTCRLGTDEEAGFLGSVPVIAGNEASPSLTSAPGVCRLEWDLSAATPGDRYVLHFVLASVHGGGTSTAGADLMADVVSEELPTCVGSGVFTTPIGEPFSTTFIGNDPSGGALALFTVGGSPGVVSAPPGQLFPSPLPSFFAWTPTYADRGRTRVVLASFTDELMRTGTCSLALQVPSCVGWGQPCVVGAGQCATTGTMGCNDAEAFCDAVAGAPAPEVCGDGIDNDCDGVVDNGCLDSDGDGLWDDQEALLGTDPFDADSDDDGVPDGAEVAFAEDSDGDGLINALDPDSDDDGLFDGTELGYDCGSPATDPSKGHCVPDADHGATKTSPLLADTDGGGMEDGREDKNLNGALDAGERDPLDPADDGGCFVDDECGGKKSGKVCVAAACVDGCRGTGNGCAAGKTCTSTTDAVGDCVTPGGSSGSGTGSTGVTGGSGLVTGAGGGDAVSAEPGAPTVKNGGTCEVAWGTSSSNAGIWAMLAVSAVVTAVRRRRS